MVHVEELTLMRIFVGENDRWEHQPLFEALVELFRAEGFSGATVVKGVMGFGRQGAVHTDRILRLAADLPVIVEIIDSQEKFNAILPRLGEMLQGGLVTMEKARVMRCGSKVDA
jgi:PII-like signaling protein